MNPIFWMSLMAAARSPPSLELRVVPTNAPTHEARIFNTGKKAAWLQITVPDVFAVDAELFDRNGGKIEGTHTWAARGAPRFSHRFERVEPGSDVLVGQFSWDEARSLALSGGWSWNLSEHRGSVVNLTFRFTQACDERTTEIDPMGGRPALPGEAPRPDPASPKRIEDIYCGVLEGKAAIDLP